MVSPASSREPHPQEAPDRHTVLEGMVSVTSPRLVSDMKTGSFISFVHCTPSVSRSIWKVEGTQRTIVKVQCLSISAIFLSFVILRSGL